jgi:small multidrug resistance family-3 protein
VYIVAALGWAVLAEGARLTPWDVAGAALCLLGAAVIVAGAR